MHVQYDVPFTHILSFKAACSQQINFSSFVPRLRRSLEPFESFTPPSCCSFPPPLPLPPPGVTMSILFEGVFVPVVIGALSGAIIGQTANHVVSMGFDALQTTRERLHGLKQSKNKPIIAVLNELEGMDIDAKLLTVNSLIESLEKQENTDPKFVLALEQVKQCFEPIQITLDIIHKELEIHEHRYLAYYRSPHTTELLDSLRRKLKVLDQRCDWLIKITTIDQSQKPEA